MLALIGRILPSKPYQYWHVVSGEAFKTLSILAWALRLHLQNPINTGWTATDNPSKPYQYWLVYSVLNLQNPINTGFLWSDVPSKPYQYWLLRLRPSFKTLSILAAVT